MGGIPWGQQTICPGETVDILAYYTEQIPWYSYTITSWSVPISDPTAVDQPGVYSIDATDPWDGCWYSATFEIIAAVVVDLGPDQEIVRCSDQGPMDLNDLFPASGGNAAWWHDGTPISSSAASAVALPGEYRIVAGSSAACNDTAFVHLTVSSAPDLGPDQDLTICAGTSVDLTTAFNTAGLTSQWVQTGVPIPEPTAASAPGSYGIVATSADGCVNEALVTLNIGPQPDLGPDRTETLCEGSAIDLTELFDPMGFSTTWYLENAVIPSPTAVTDAGTYMVIAGDPATCSDVAQVTLNIGAQPTLGADVTANVCSGSTVDLTSFYFTSGLLATWWYEGMVMATPTSASEAGTYLLVASNAAGCSDSAQVQVANDAQPDLGADAAITFCGNTTFDLNTLYATAGLTTEWTRLGAIVNDPSAITNAGLYRLVASYGTACMDTVHVDAVVNLSPVLAPDMFASVCEGDAEDLVSYFNLSNLVAEWTLSGEPVPDAGAATQEGSYRIVAMNVEGCSDTAYVQLTVDQTPSLGEDQTLTLCDGLHIDLDGLVQTGSNQNVWSSDGQIVGDPEHVSQPGLYQLTSTNDAGCSAMAMVSISLLASPILGEDLAVQVCDGALFDLSELYDTSALNTLWSMSGMPVNAPSTVVAAGSYMLVVTNASECRDTAVVHLGTIAPPDLGDDLSFILCPWETVDLSSTFHVPGATLSFILNGNEVLDPYNAGEAGTYQIVARNTYGCSDTAIALVDTIACACMADFTHDAQCAQDPVQFTLITDREVLGAHWTFGDAALPSHVLHPSVAFASAGSVPVLLQVELACGSFAVEHVLELEDCSQRCHVWVPSAFTPNGDGWNEAWTWEGDCRPAKFSMNIFDRFGEVIYSTTDPSLSWDGTYAGKPTPPGVYAYRLGYTLPYQEHHEVMGSITLVR